MWKRFAHAVRPLDPVYAVWVAVFWAVLILSAIILIRL